MEHEIRRDEIFQLVAANELREATSRYMDFVQDFAGDFRKYRREATMIRREYNALQEEIRKFGYTEEMRREIKRLIDNMLATCEEICIQLSTAVKYSTGVHTQTKNSSTKQTETPQKPTYPSSAGLSTANLIQRNDVTLTTKNVNETSTQPSDRNSKSKVANESSLQMPALNSKSTLTQSVHSKARPSLNLAFAARQISKEYKGSTIKFKLKPIDLLLNLGEITAIVGENGNGKSTLLKIISGVLSPTSGTVDYTFFNGNKEKDFYAIKQQIAYIPQELTRWRGRLVNNLHFAAAIHNVQNNQNKEEIEFVVTRLGLERFMNAEWEEISGGYKMRFALAKALLGRPKLLILDEPLANLDINTQLHFMQDLRSLVNSVTRPMSAVVSSQHLHEIEGITDKIIFLKDGQALYNGLLSDFGSDRKDNAFEIGCDLLKDRFLDAIAKLDFKKVDQTGNRFIVYVSRQVSPTTMINTLISKGVTISYFQDISRSTRRLFDSDVI